MTPEEMDSQTGADRDREPYFRTSREIFHQNHILRQIAGERDRQDDKWGIQHHPDGTSKGYSGLADLKRAVCDRKAETGKVTWLDILVEETYEAFAETDPVRLRKELLQAAAVAVAWVEDIDSRA